MNNCASDFDAIVSHGCEMDTQDSMDNIIEYVKPRLNGRRPKACIVYFSIYNEIAVIKRCLCREWPEIKMVGCTTHGEFSSVSGFHDESIVVAFLISDTCDFTTGVIDTSQQDLKTHCEQALTPFASDPPKLCLLFCDVIQSNHSELLVECFRKTLPDTLIYGGAAGDSWAIKQSCLITEQTETHSNAVYLMITGHLQYGVGLEMGCDTLGKRGVITKSKKNIVYEIDGKPALTFYKKSLLQPVLPSGELPVRLYDTEGNVLFIRVSVDSYDEQIGSVAYLGSMPQGAAIELTTISKDSIINGVQGACRKAFSPFDKDNKPKLALFTSCSARRAYLGTLSYQEGEAIKQCLEPDIPFCGFFSYGEIAPYQLGCQPQFHNYSFASLFLR